jgi:NAD-dependent dihydropyrimidine dehydrogenase PreA subunit
MAMFIKVEVDPATASNPGLARKLVEVCPVNIFALDDEGRVKIEERNLDECTLCDLCLQAVPDGSVRVVKLYE